MKILIQGQVSECRLNLAWFMNGCEFPKWSILNILVCWSESNILGAMETEIRTALPLCKPKTHYYSGAESL